MKTYINTFHNSEYKVRNDFDYDILSYKSNNGDKSAAKRLSRFWEALCGIENCSCGDHIKEATE